MTALAGTADDVAEEVAGAAGPAGIDVAPHSARLPGGRTRGFVKVQDGCDCHCAYCVIPRCRACTLAPCERRAEGSPPRVAQGQPEMVMTGISVGDYHDPEQGLELGDLMRKVAALDGVERVRLSSVEVIHVRDSLLDPRGGQDRSARTCACPLQSGDNGVLASMGRNYDSAGSSRRSRATASG